MQSAAMQHDDTATHAPSPHTFFPIPVRFVSQPSLSGAPALQSCHPVAQLWYMQVVPVHMAPRLCCEIVSHVTPQAPQLAVVSRASQKPEQHDVPAPHGCVASQPVVHWLLGLQTCVAAQSVSAKHCTHT
jgi:hypothetical protein